VSTAKPKGLGRGLDVLLAANPSTDRERTGELPVDSLQPGKYQPRTRMDPGALEELAASIKSQGLIQPISVRPLDPGRYEIIAGERRWRAARQAGLSHVPVLIRDIPDRAALAVSLIENIQREDLNPLEEASGIQRLIDEFQLTHEQAADAVGRSRSATTNLLRLLQLAAPVQELLLAGDLEMGHARALLALPKAEQGELAAEVVEKRYSVRETEKRVQREHNPERVTRGQSRSRQGVRMDRDWQRVEEELADRLGAPVKIMAKEKGAGELVIHFASLDQLDGLLARLQNS
jgi:ParB family chromosome partitioning protein